MIKAVHLPATGPGPFPEDWEEMDETSVIAHNWLLHNKKSNTYPPLEIINEYLGRGMDDQGMSGGMQWEPCSINLDQYSKYIDLIKGVILDQSQIPDDIEIIEHWYLYKHEINHQVPYREHRNYWNRKRELEFELEKARKSSDEEREIKLYSEYLKVSNESSAFFMKHCRRE